MTGDLSRPKGSVQRLVDEPRQFIGVGIQSINQAQDGIVELLQELLHRFIALFIHVDVPCRPAVC